MYKYFCGCCGCRFTSEIPERTNGILNDISCPECGAWDIYPDTPHGAVQSVRALTDYENETEV